MVLDVLIPSLGLSLQESESVKIRALLFLSVRVGNKKVKTGYESFVVLFSSNTRETWHAASNAVAESQGIWSQPHAFDFLSIPTSFFLREPFQRSSCSCLPLFASRDMTCISQFCIFHFVLSTSSFLCKKAIDPEERYNMKTWICQMLLLPLFPVLAVEKKHGCLFIFLCWRHNSQWNILTSHDSQICFCISERSDHYETNIDVHVQPMLSESKQMHKEAQYIKLFQVINSPNHVFIQE